MNWITKFIKPKIQSLFKKRTSETDEILWTTCGCKNLIYKEDMEANLKCCPRCGAHHKLSCTERFQILFDNKEFELLATPNPKDDPINFSDTKKEVIYIDTIYNPSETKTFKYLKEEGKKVFNGLDMFIYQGQKSFYLWNKINPEIDDGLLELLNSKLK